MSIREVTDKELVFLKLKVIWSNTNVRITLAHNGVALNVLINDPKSIVRHEVAKQGYRLDILLKDSSPEVRSMAMVCQKELSYKKAKDMTDEIFRQAGCL